MSTDDDCWSRPIACHENLECLLSLSRHRLTHLVAENAAALPLFRASLPCERLVTFRLTRRLRAFLNDDATFRHSDLQRRLAASGALAFMPSYRASWLIERIARQLDLELLSPRYQLQRQLENKIQFQRLLEQHRLPVPHSRVLTATEQIAALDGFPLVCQLPGSEGMEGTFLVGSRQQLRAGLASSQLRLPLLCRQRLRGVVLGITVVVGARQLLLSAVRHQCRGLDHREDLVGVQWLAGERLGRRQRDRIGAVAADLGLALRNSGFRGSANVDLILTGDEVSIIECNPRFSSATPQLALEPALLHGLDFIAEHLRALRGQPLGGHRPRLPRSSFEGACVDVSERIVATMRACRRRVVSAMPELGVYDFGSGQLQLVSRDIAQLRGPARLLFHYSSPAGTHISARSDLGSLLSSFPLFDFRRGRAHLNREGTALIDQLFRQLRFARPHRSLAELAARR